MRPYQDIKRDLQAARERKDTIGDDLQRLREQAKVAPLDDGQLERQHNLETGMSRAFEEIEELEDEARDGLAALASDPRYIERIHDGDPRPTSGDPRLQDRKSTRLNSSHVKISYAVFCLKKKNNRRNARV